MVSGQVKNETKPNNNNTYRYVFDNIDNFLFNIDKYYMNYG